MRAIRVTRTGGPEALQLSDVPVPEPGPGQVRVRIAFSGVNFIDTYHRSGLYPLDLPFTPGSEAAGVVDAVGAGVDRWKPGHRVAYASERGSYAEYAVVPAAKLVAVQPEVSLEAAAAVMLQGMTAHYLTHDTFRLGPRHTALVHAAAGGVGLLLVQMARFRGARVIGTVSTDEKAALAHNAGAGEVVIYTRKNFRERALALTEGKGVDVAYDSVGRATFDESMRSIRPRGMLVLFGNSSGPVPPIDPLLLSKRGSLFVTRPTLHHYTAERVELLNRARDIFSLLKAGKLDVRMDRVIPLEEAAQAHALLESRKTSGKLLLRVER